MDLNNKEIAKVSFWLVSFLLIFELILVMVNTSSTILNILGLLLMIAFITISFKTKCFINLNLRKKTKKIKIIKQKKLKNEKID